MKHYYDILVETIFLISGIYSIVLFIAAIKLKITNAIYHTNFDKGTLASKNEFFFIYFLFFMTGFYCISEVPAFNPFSLKTAPSGTYSAYIGIAYDENIEILYPACIRKERDDDNGSIYYYISYFDDKGTDVHVEESIKDVEERSTVYVSDWGYEVLMQIYDKQSSLDGIENHISLRLTDGVRILIAIACISDILFASTRRARIIRNAK